MITASGDTLTWLWHGHASGSPLPCGQGLTTWSCACAGLHTFAKSRQHMRVDPSLCVAQTTNSWTTKNRQELMKNVFCLLICPCSTALWLTGGWQPWHHAHTSLPHHLRKHIGLWSSAVHHTLLLPHVCALLHPAGSGSCMAAALAGVPQISCPLHFDQFYWVSIAVVNDVGELLRVQVRKHV